METTNKSPEEFAQALYEKHQTDTFKRAPLREAAHEYGFTKKESYKLFITGEGCRVGHGTYSIAKYLSDASIDQTPKPVADKPKTRKHKKDTAVGSETPKAKKTKKPKPEPEVKDDEVNMDLSPKAKRRLEKELQKKQDREYEAWVDNHVKEQPLRRKQKKETK